MTSLPREVWVLERHHNGVMQFDSALFKTQEDARGVALAGEEPIRYVPEKKWVSVQERLPEFGTLVLVVNHEGDYVVVVLERSNGEPYWAAVDGDLPLCNYPHWMPLPAMPKAGG